MADGVSDVRITTPQMIAMPKSLEAAAQGDEGGFAKVLGEMIGQADSLQKNAETEARELAAGRGDSLAAVTAISQADLSLRFLMGLRNRALEAFNEIIRMPI